MLDFAMTTDYVTSGGSPLPYLQRIAQAGWKWIHWCHNWNNNHIYSDEEVAEIDRWCKDLGLRVLDIHGSAGYFVGWDHVGEYSRKKGVELVRNRIEMAQRLGCGTVIMHPASERGPAAYREKRFAHLLRSIDELIPDLRRASVRLAIENMERDNFDQLARLMSLYPPDVMGICYDPGHGNIAGNGLDRLAAHLDRLIALHLNDNDGMRDLHQPPFAGTVDWQHMATLIARSIYARPAMSVEVLIKHSGISDESTFLNQSLAAARRFGEMIDAARSPA